MMSMLPLIYWRCPVILSSLALLRSAPPEYFGILDSQSFYGQPYSYVPPDSTLLDTIPSFSYSLKKASPRLLTVSGPTRMIQRSLPR